MSNQPLNLLASTNSQVGRNENNNNSNNTANDSTHQQQLNHDQNKLALASLFSSLSSLANSQQPMALHLSTSHQALATTTSNTSEYQPQKQQQNPVASSTSTSTLTSSLQSVMAAAMMQQQLVTAAAVSQHQQIPQPPTSMFLNTADRGNFFNHRIENDLQAGDGNGQQQQMQQRINYCTICNKELCNKYFMKTHMLKMHKINLEMEQPEGEAGTGGEGNEEDSSERVEEEDSDSSGDEQCSNKEQLSLGGEQHSSLNEGEILNDSSNIDSNNMWSPVANQKKSVQSISTKKNSTGQSKSQSKKQAQSQPSKSNATSVMNGFAGNSMGGVVCDICNKELCSKYFLKVHKQNTHGITTDYQDANQFMYPFANPIAGPNPFLAPASLATGLAPPGPFPQNFLDLFTGSQQQQQQQQHQQQQCFDESSVSKKSGSSKRMRLSQDTTQSTSPSLANIEKSGDRRSAFETANMSNKQYDSVYRLILAQQQQQQQSPQQPQPPLTSLVSSTIPPAPLLPIDPMGANQLGALMCFGAMGPGAGPFGAGMSPAMIVDNILRNQHLFNRNNAGGMVSQQLNGDSKLDKNNNNNVKTESKQANSKTSPSSNSRYFSHYTEACPMCDRRFKSIKWLKTHMMNDHKQEIGAYMQMMMQYLYANKSQQMAAAATMAALEQQQQQQHQQQQQQQQRHQDLINQFAKNQLQHNQSASLLNKCSNSNIYQQQQPNPLFSPGHIGIKQNDLLQYHKQGSKINSRESSSPEFIGEQSQHDLNDFAIDARCRQESLTPDESLNRHSSSSS